MNKRTLLFSSIALGSTILGLAVWGADRSTPAPSAQSSPTTFLLRSEGRVITYPGGDVTVGSDLGGTLTQVRVQEGDHVTKGQLLALIDARQEGAALGEALSRIRELQADERFQTTELKRHETLQASGIISRQNLDQTRTLLDLAKARREAAEATAERLKVTLSKLRIEAPIEGIVIGRFVNVGETVAAGARMIQIAQTNRLRLEAEIDEFDLSRISLGDLVKVRAEGYNGHWMGVVEEIPSQVIGRRLKPQDPSRPSDTRVLMVKVGLKEATPLKLGQRVELEIQPLGTR